MFNTLGSAIFFVILLFWPGFMSATFRQWFPAPATQIAMFHTFFNMTCTLLFLPFCQWFVRTSKLLIREKQPVAAETYLDERMLSSASLAITQLKKENDPPVRHGYGRLPAPVTRPLRPGTRASLDPPNS